MPADTQPGRFCAQWFQTFLVRGSGDNVYTVAFTRGEGPRCTCPSFAWNAKRERLECKHIKRVMAEACLWNEQWYSGGARTMAPAPGTLTQPTIPNQTCPQCGGPVVSVLVAV